MTEPEGAGSVPDAMRSWIDTLRNLAYAEHGADRDQKIDWADKVLNSQANYLARIEAHRDCLLLGIMEWGLGDAPYDRMATFLEAAARGEYLAP